MKPLPRDFMTKIAREYKLSSKQEEAFVELFSTGKSELEIAENVLYIFRGAFRTRMTGVYRKFNIGINANRPTKLYELHNFLLEGVSETPWHSHSRRSKGGH